MGTQVAMAHRQSVRILLTVLSILVLVTSSLTGCARTAEPSSSVDIVRDSPAAVPAEPSEAAVAGDIYEEEKGLVAPAAPGTSPSVSPAGSVQAQLIVSATARVHTDDPKATYATFEANVIKAGGNVDASTLELERPSPRISATVRIPAEKFNEFLASLDSYGTVEERSTRTENVGAAVADIDGRIRGLETSIARLEKLMDQATNTSDLLEAEQQIAMRQAELEGLKSQQRWFKDQVAMSTLEITFTSSVSFNVESHSVWDQSWKSFLDGLTSLLVFFVWSLPWIGLALVVGIPLLIWRSRRRSRRRRVLAEETSLGAGKDGGAPKSGAVDEGTE